MKHHATTWIGIFMAGATGAGCTGPGPGTATAEIRVLRVGSGIRTPALGVNMSDVLTDAKEIFATRKFRDDVESRLSKRVPLPAAWYDRITLGVQAEQLELLVLFSGPNVEEAAQVANSVASVLAEYLGQTGRYTANISRRAY